MIRPILIAGAVFATGLAGCASMPASKPFVDKYGFMEDVQGDKAIAWVKAQNKRSLDVLTASPRFETMRQEALTILNSKERLALGAIRNGFVYNFWQDETNVRGIWRRSPLGAYKAGQPSWETILDIDALAKAENKNWVYKGANCAPGDAMRCLVSLSDGGKDAVTVREFDIPSKSFVAGGFLLPEAKQSAAWISRDALLIGTDWGGGTVTESGYPFVIKRLERGKDLASATEVVRGDKTDVGVWPFTVETAEGEVLTGVSEADTFFTSKTWLFTADGPKKLTLPEKASVVAVHKGQLVFTIEQDWTVGAASFKQGALLSMPMADAFSATPAVKMIYGPGPRESIIGTSDTKDAILVAGYRNVTGRLLRFTFDGRDWLESSISLPPNGAVSIVAADTKSNEAFVVYENFLAPDTLFSVDARAGRAARVQALPAFFDASKFDSFQYEATSKDGTKIPYFVVAPKGRALDGTAPTLLYGYGGFQVSMTLGYSGTVGKLWLERGGVYVLANIRGGGEFGPAWHQAGLKTNRQVIYDDFIAVAEDLIARKVTSPRRLGIMGGSNGGLLMGVMLTQRPDLFRAAVVQVPLLDMLNYANPNMLAGASWVAEYGDPRLGADGKPVNPQERAFLERLSPYQNLRKRADFPIPLIVTSTKDDRVTPAHARKFGARLEELGMPFWYYENIDGGHSAAANLQESAKRMALEYSYLAERLMD
jgi:prolyl oligopeptidase